jgi:hypothetical protein
MVDKALVLENQRGIMERKRKMQHTGAQGSNKRFHDGSSSQELVLHIKNSWQRSYVSRIPHENFGYLRENHLE